MAFNALNSAAPMNMPDFEDASPPHFQPDGTPQNLVVGVFAALQNAKEIFEGRWMDRPYEVVKKGQPRSYKINKPPAQWPTRFAASGDSRTFDSITVAGEPGPGVIAVRCLGAQPRASHARRHGVYYYSKIQTLRKRSLSRTHALLEGLIVSSRHLQIKVV